MCVALPGKVLSIDEDGKWAEVDFSGNRVRARAGLIPIQAGDQVLVHAGCILQKVTQGEAEEINSIFQKIGSFSS